jgi:hypothetical protein
VGGIDEVSASIKLEQCSVHLGMKCLKRERYADVKAKKCNNCYGCKDCRQPVPLVIPEGTGGSGCAAEVAAKAEALRAAALSKASSSKPGTSGAQQMGGTADAGAGTDGDRGTSRSGSLDAKAPANSALVECAVCHRKPGDPGVPATLKLCGGCRMMRYCSAECQKKDWKMGPKAVCQRYQGTLAEMQSRKTCSG